MKANLTVAALLTASVTNAQIFSEFEPNPAGGDPANQNVELFGTALAAFDLWILSIENDGFDGSVDRASNVTGSFDANGIAVVSIPDLENPSNTLVLTDSFTGSTSTDIDPLDDGVLDLSTIGTVLDAVGVSDEVGDDGVLYGSILGGFDILFNGQFEPLNVFRLGSTGAWYNSVTLNFGQPDERIGLFGPNNPTTEILNAPSDTLATTFGSINPTVVPEPSMYGALIGLLALGFTVSRRRGR